MKRIRTLRGGKNFKSMIRTLYVLWLPKKTHLCSDKITSLYPLLSYAWLKTFVSNLFRRKLKTFKTSQENVGRVWSHSEDIFELVTKFL